MTEDELLERWSKERPIYEKWGEHVALCLIDAIRPNVAPISTELFIKLPIHPRVKSDGSFLTKAFYNSKKSYSDPFAQITDKVGLRVVVLLASQISKIEAALEHCSSWSFSKDRDFEQEIASSPTTFDYQSVHYIVRSNSPLQLGGIDIPAGTPCEVQIRTLLQHAHSELTHDTIYKPSVQQTPEMIRSASKAMALIEATNDYFERVAQQIERLISPTRKLTEELAALYREKVGKDADITKAESLLIEAFGSEDADAIPRLREFLDQKSYVSDKIADRARLKILFRQPSILLVYKAASERPCDTKAVWPLTEGELAPIYSDLGIAFDNI